MSCLYIIGNGFDCAHGLKTSYWDFHNYLNRYAEDFLVELEKMYGFYPIDLDNWRIQEQIGRIIKQRNDSLQALLWRNFEQNLTNIDEGTVLDFSSSVADSMDLESGLVGVEDTLDIYWEDQYNFISELQNYLFKWIKKVRLSKAYPRKKALTKNCDDYFLSFNYTNTLERVYQINPNHITHIHGGLLPFCDTKPIIGHGQAEKIKQNRELAEKYANEFDEVSTSIYNAIANYYERTLKETGKCLNRHFQFFQNLSRIDSVVVIGHSLGKVDFPYFKEVLHVIPHNTPWTVLFYSVNEKQGMINSLMEIGVPQEYCHLEPVSDYWD